VTLFTVFFHPGEGLRVLFLIKDAIAQTTVYFHQVNGFNTHTEEVFEEVLIDNGTGNAHGNAAHREVGLPFHHSNSQTGFCKTQYFFFYIGGNRGIAGVLYIAPVDSKGRKPFLCVARQNRRQINRAGTLGTIKAPNGFRTKRIHIHGFGTVAPARRNRQRDAHVFSIKFFCTGCGFGHSPNTGVGNHTFYRFTIWIFQIFADQFCRVFRHRHNLTFKRFPHAAVATVDGWTNTNLW